MKSLKRLSIALCTVVSASTAFAEVWAPSEVQKKAVVTRAATYFAALDARDHATGYGMLAASVKKSASEADFTRLQARNLTEHGAAVARKVSGVSWYPKGSAVGTGVAAAIDFSGSTEPGKLFCGYVAFIELDDEQFVLLRDDTTYFTPVTVAEMNLQKRRELLDRPGCRQFLNSSR